MMVVAAMALPSLGRVGGLATAPLASGTSRSMRGGVPLAPRRAGAARAPELGVGGRSRPSTLQPVDAAVEPAGRRLGARRGPRRCQAAGAGGGGLWTEPWDPEPRPWGEFLADVERPPSAKAWQQRMRINARYYRTNYALLVGVAVLLNALIQPFVLLGFALMFLSLAIVKEYWTNVVIAPLFFRATRRRLDLHMTLDGMMVLTVSAPAGGMTASGLSIAPVTFNPYQISLYLLLSGSFLLFCNSVLAFLVLMAGIKLGGTAAVAHMSLRKPNLSSSISGLKDVASREELNQNLKSIWDQLRGRSGEN